MLTGVITTSCVRLCFTRLKR